MTSDLGSRQGIRAANSGFAIGGTRIWTVSGIANVTQVPSRVGDLLIDYSAGKLYVAGGTSATTDWKLVTSA